MTDRKQSPPAPVDEQDKVVAPKAGGLMRSGLVVSVMTMLLSLIHI